LRAVVDIFGGQQGGNDLSGAGVHAKVQLTPRPTQLGAVLLMQPLARAAQLQPRAVHQQVQGFGTGAGVWPWHLQRHGPAAQRAVVRDGEIETELAYDRAFQPFRLPQSQPEHCLERQCRQDGQGCDFPLTLRLSQPIIKGLASV